jgi:hypothetical protein
LGLSIILWVITFIILAASIILLAKKIWLPYSKFLVLIAGYFILVNFLFLFDMPHWINNIRFGIAFLIFPILDGITTRIALTKYGAKEANPVMAWLIKRAGINIALLTPFLLWLVIVLLFWQQFDSSTLFAFIIGYLAVIVNNILVIQKRKKVYLKYKNSEFQG